jgi:hypothetical protein
VQPTAAYTACIELVSVLQVLESIKPLPPVYTLTHIIRRMNSVVALTSYARSSSSQGVFPTAFVGERMEGCSVYPVQRGHKVRSCDVLSKVGRTSFSVLLRAGLSASISKAIRSGSGSEACICIIQNERSNAEQTHWRLQPRGNRGYGHLRWPRGIVLHPSSQQRVQRCIRRH